MQSSLASYFSDLGQLGKGLNIALAKILMIFTKLKERMYADRLSRHDYYYFSPKGNIHNPGQS